MDSTASFKERALRLGLPEAAINRLVDSKLATSGQFAFISSFQPGSADEKPLVEAITKILTEAPSATELASWRRLYFECHTAAMTDLRTRLERKDDEAPRKLLMPERVERLERAKKTLTGITIDSQLEPAHRLVDAAVQQAEDATVRYIPLKDCLSRESELMHSKSEPAIEFLPDGTMKLGKKQQEIHAETSGDLRAKMAMQRRALAYHIAGICNYQALDALVQRMFSLMTKEPVKGFRAVSLQQISNADREMWMQAAQSARGKSLWIPLDRLTRSWRRRSMLLKRAIICCLCRRLPKAKAKLRPRQRALASLLRKGPSLLPKGDHQQRRGRAKGLICPQDVLLRQDLVKGFAFNSIGSVATTRTRTSAFGAYMCAG